MIFLERKCKLIQTCTHHIPAMVTVLAVHSSLFDAQMSRSRLFLPTRPEPPQARTPQLIAKGYNDFFLGAVNRKRFSWIINCTGLCV